MDNLNLVIMGKTGAGKSTLINVVMEEDLAPTGIGQAVTKENKVYSKDVILSLGKETETTDLYTMVSKKLNLYDTVGLEIDNNITRNTLLEIQKFIKQAQKNEREKDITLVWFCVNYASSRFESYEVELIKELSIKYEIPFVIVITQCYTNEKGELEKQIEIEFPEITVVRILAKEYRTRGGTVSAFGMQDLLKKSVIDYDRNKVTILENKLNRLSKDRQSKINEIRDRGKKCIKIYGNKASKIGIVPVGCIPIIHGMCRKMLRELNNIVGINIPKSLITDKFVDTAFGIIATPFMGVPIFSSIAASSYIETAGETYLKALLSIIEKSSDADLKNNDLMSKRIREELVKRKR